MQRRGGENMSTIIGQQIVTSLGGVVIDPEVIEALNNSVLDLSKEIPDPEMLVSLDDKPICTRGNFSFIIGLPGSRKSFLCTGIAGAFLCKDGCMGLENSNGTGRLLWFDTEQAPGHVARVARRLHRIVGIPDNQNSDNIIISMLREYQSEIRRKIVMAGIQLYKPDFVVIDGLADLITNPNDPEQSDSITNDLMAVTKKYNCHILTVIHCNVGQDKARGHLGSDALRKCETAIFVKADGDCSICTWTKTRDMRPEDFCFGVSDGLPVNVPYKTQQAKTDKLQQIFNDSMPMLPNTISYTELCNKVITVAGVKKDAAKKRIARALDLGLIVKNSVGMYHRPEAKSENGVMPF
jgi:hypothetical protein